MADFVIDTFTGSNGTNILDHTGETGATWSPVVFFTSSANIRTVNLEIQSNAIGVDTSGFSPAIKASGAPSGADVAIEIGLNWLTTSSAEMVTLIARMSADEEERYMMNIGLDPTGSYAYLGWRHSGSNHDDGANAASGFTPTGAHTFRWEITGDFHELFYDGVSIYTCTNALITALGDVGIQFVSADTDQAAVISSFTASDIAGGASVFWQDFLKSAEVIA